MLNIISSNYERPLRLTDTKDRDYDVKFGRYIISHANNMYQNERIIKGVVNKAFYKGNQWILAEDLETFLMDESGDSRNRIRLTHNLIRPMVELLRGNAIRMDFNAKAVAISPKAFNRREVELGKLKFLTRLASQVADPYKQKIQDEALIGDTEQETEEIFEREFIDEYVTAINYLINYVEANHNMRDITVEIAEDMALNGIGVAKTFERNGEQVIEVTNPLYFFFDTSCKKNDLTDSEYMGEYWYMLPTEIYERFPDISNEERRAIDEYVRNSAQTSSYNFFDQNNDGRVPVFEVYWKDIERQEYAWVKDDFGYELFTIINDENYSKYTDKDIIEPSNEKHLERLNTNLKEIRYVDVLRKCIFIPQEAVSGAGGSKGRDIVLEHGEVDFQEKDLLHPSNVQFPYKAYCWSYQEGEVLSPIDDAIDPQRFINRLISVAESQINNSGGTGTMYDIDSIDPQGGEEEMIRNFKVGKPVRINAKRMGVNNSVAHYDHTIKSGTLALFNVVSNMKGVIQDITGINEQMQGTQGGNELVGVTKLLIQRGTLMQEPFYYALSRVMVQIYQSIATQGKMIYSEYERKLAIIMGDKLSNVVEITKDMKSEDFKVFVKRSSSDQVERQTVDETALGFLQAGLLSKDQFSNVYGIGSMEDLSKSLREHMRFLARQEVQATREEERMQPLMEQQMREEEERSMAREDRNMIAKHIQDRERQSHDMDMMMARESMKGMKDIEKAKIIANSKKDTEDTLNE